MGVPELLRNKWISVKSGLLPPIEEDYYAWNRSIDVLATDGRVIYLVYAMYWKDEWDNKTEWRISGRDGYDLDNVTHWMYLPELPEVDDGKEKEEFRRICSDTKTIHQRTKRVHDSSQRRP